MRTLVLIFLFSFCFVACNKNDKSWVSSKKYPPFILAGQTSGLGIYHYVFNPPISFQLPAPGHFLDSCILDLNYDLIDDVVLKMDAEMSSGSRSFHHTVRPLGKNEIAVHKAKSQLADTIRPNDTIGKSLFWVNSECFLFHYHHSNKNFIPDKLLEGFWRNAGIKYLGIRIYAADTSYGWIRIKIPTEFYQTIYEYGCTIGYN